MTKQPDFPDLGKALTPGNDTARIATALRSSAAGADDYADTASLGVHALEAVLRARALRLKHLPPELLGEPAWDMLLELLHAEITKRRLSVPMLCEAARVGDGTGRRWIGALEGKGLCAIGSDGNVHLSADGCRAVRAYFAELTGQLVTAAPDDAL
jgi:hypothetical protein